MHYLTAFVTEQGAVVDLALDVAEHRLDISTLAGVLKPMPEPKTSDRLQYVTSPTPSGYLIPLRGAPV